MEFDLIHTKFYRALTDRHFDALVQERKDIPKPPSLPGEGARLSFSIAIIIIN